MNDEDPQEVTLDTIAIHTRHSGEYHGATAARVWASAPSDRHAATGGGPAWRLLVDGELNETDAKVTLPRTEARVWRVELASGPSRQVVVRGLRFLHASVELFPSLIPWTDRADGADGAGSARGSGSTG